jgi:hypothetical protein
MPSGGETGAREPLGYHRDCRLAKTIFSTVDLSMKSRFCSLPWQIFVFVLIKLYFQLPLLHRS